MGFHLGHPNCHKSISGYFFYFSLMTFDSFTTPSLAHFDSPSRLSYLGDCLAFSHKLLHQAQRNCHRRSCCMPHLCLHCLHLDPFSLMVSLVRNRHQKYSYYPKFVKLALMHHSECLKPYSTQSCFSLQN